MTLYKILESRFAHIKMNQMKMKRKISNDFDGCYLCYYFFVVLYSAVLPCISTHNKNGDIYLKCNCIIVEAILLSAMGVFVFCVSFLFHHFILVHPTISIDHPLNRSTHRFFYPFIYFEYVFFVVQSKTYKKTKRIKMENIVDTLELKVKYCMYYIVAYIKVCKVIVDNERNAFRINKLLE